METMAMGMMGYVGVCRVQKIYIYIYRVYCIGKERIFLGGDGMFNVDVL